MGARKSVREGKELLASLGSSHPSRFLELFHYQLIQQYADKIRNYEPLISKWVESELLSRERLRSQDPGGGEAALVRMGAAAGSYKAAVDLPLPAVICRPLFAGSLRSASCRDKVDPEQFTSYRRMLIDRKSLRESGGGYRIIHGESRNGKGGYVLVWACIDLGFRKFYGGTACFRTDRRRRSMTEIIHQFYCTPLHLRDLRFAPSRRAPWPHRLSNTAPGQDPYLARKATNTSGKSNPTAVLRACQRTRLRKNFSV